MTKASPACRLSVCRSRPPCFSLGVGPKPVQVRGLHRLDYASPQSFGRHLRVVLGITPSEFRSRYPFCVVLDRFLDRMVRPHVEVWRTFKPLAPGKG